MDCYGHLFLLSDHMAAMDAMARELMECCVNVRFTAVSRLIFGVIFWTAFDPNETYGAISNV